MTAATSSTLAEACERPDISHLPRVERFPDIVGTFMGRDALTLIAAHLALAEDDVVLLPLYNCQDVLKTFMRTNRVVFYDVREDFTIAPEELLSRLNVGRVKMMIIVNYFGLLQPHRDEIKSICEQRGITLIEDCAHSLLTEGSGDTGDFAIYSFRKLLPIPDGGGLKANRIAKPLVAKFHSRLYADFLSTLILAKSSLNIKSNTLSRAHIMSKAKDFAPKIQPPSTESRILPLSHFAERGMRHLSFPEIIERRRADFQFWQEFCKRRSAFSPLIPDLPPSVCPPGFPVKVKNRESLEVTAREAGIVLRVHWRLDRALGPDCRVSHDLASTTLTLPIYPELDEKDRRVLCEILSHA